MHRITSAAILTALSSFAFVPSPAHADCAADIETTEEQLDSRVVSKRTEGEVQAARNIVKKAKAALANGKKKKCEKLIKKAQDKLGDS